MIRMMEENKNTLSKSLRELPEYVPDARLWGSIQQKLQEGMLHQALQSLPDYTPAPATWESISAKLPRKQSSFKWQYAASILLVMALSAAWLWNRGVGQQVDFSLETADLRLQSAGQPRTDLAYQQLLAYCQTETSVCERKEYRLLKDEYEKLEMASEQLSHAIGRYNTEPELVRQLNNVEKQKTAILNEMAKMI